jgi:hypothetical protein
MSKPTPEQAPRVERMPDERLAELASDDFNSGWRTNWANELIQEAIRARASELEWKAKAEKEGAQLGEESERCFRARRDLAAAEARAEELRVALADKSERLHLAYHANVGVSFRGCNTAMCVEARALLVAPPRETK